MSKQVSPLRIQVYVLGNREYQVIVRDTEVSGSRGIVERLRTVWGKGGAVDLAKKFAIERHLPFSPTKDIITDTEIDYGPIQQCAGCGKESGRALRPILCRACQVFYEAGKQVADIEQREDCGIVISYLLPFGRLSNARDLSDRLAALLARIASTKVGSWLDHTKRHRAKRIIQLGRDDGYTGNSANGIRLTPNEATAMQETVDFIAALCEDAYQEGVKQGDGLLHRLAQGQVSIDQYEDALVKRRKK